MYEGAAALKSTSSEEYLLGKPFEFGYSEFGEDIAYKKLPQVQTTSINLQNEVNSAHDTFSRLNEDPLFLIKKSRLNK